MNFEESQSYLYSLGNEVETMKLGLENITALLTALGEPHNKYKKVQVAGTNGKGSVCAFLDSICREAGIRTGLYTSPHLVSIIERIKIDGADIAEDEFARLATRVRETAESLLSDGKLAYRPTFFEQVTAIALLAFAGHNIELAILETGLGGRFDAVTAANAEITAITRIDLDHQEYLGETIEEIAAEKAAIIREDSSVIVGRQSEKAMSVILDRCHRVGVTPNFEIYQPWIVIPSGPETVIVETTRSIYSDVCLGLTGKHQIENAEIAINIVQSLKYDLGIDIESSGAIVPGLENARHPGRLEYIGQFLLDGAHNPAGAMALVEYLREFVRSPITLIFGAMREKAVNEIAAILWPLANKIILTRPSNSRALTADELFQAKPESFDEADIIKTETVAEAIEKARAFTSEDGVIVVTGSLYLVGEVRQALLSLSSV